MADRWSLTMELTFLNSALLFGATGVAAPIIVHLIMRRKPRLVPFPALRFVKVSYQSSMRRHRLKHLLLLLLRCLLVALVALILARPLLKSDLFRANLDTPVSAVFLFDDSYSMGYEFQGRTRLAEAKAMALDVLASFPTGSEVTVLTTSAPEAETTIDRSAVRRRLADLEVADLPGACPPALDRAFQVLARSAGHKRREVFLFTDMTAAGWSGLEKAPPAVPKDVGLYVIDVGVDEDANVVLRDLTLSRQALGENAPLRLAVHVAAGQLGGRRVLELFLGGDTKRDQREVVLTPRETQEVTFEPVLRGPGLHQGRIAIKERDALAADNAVYFTVMVTPAPQVLLVSGEGGTRGVESETFFLAFALSTPAMIHRHQERVRWEVIEPAALGERRLADYAAVVLANVPRLTPESWGRLDQFVFAGGGLLIACGGRLEAADYNGPAAADLVPGTLGPAVSPPEGVSLKVEHYVHPVLAAFADGRNPDLGAALFAQYHRVTDLKPAARVVVPFTDGAPALIEHEHGRGRVLFFASAVDRDWSDFPVFKAYPVFCQQVVARLGGLREERRNFTIGQGVRLTLAPEDRGGLLTGFAPGRAEPVPLVTEEGGQGVTFPAVRRVGNYRIEVRRPARPPADAATTAVNGFSVNPDTAESNLARLGRDAVAARFPAGKIVFASSSDELAGGFMQLRVGKPVFPYVALVLLLVMVGESYLANRFHRREGMSS